MSLEFDLKFVKAEEKDLSTILDFIKKLAEYEKLSHEVFADEQKLKDTLFSKNPLAHVVFAQKNELKVGFALYFYKYSTFLAQATLHLEDLFVLPEYRGKSIGKSLMIHLTKVAIDTNCGRMEWDVLDWNKPAIDFYESLGAKALKDWFTYRLDRNSLERLST
jgi:GNAT superfamily N-acetyltransferase